MCATWTVRNRLLLYYIVAIIIVHNTAYTVLNGTVLHMIRVDDGA